MTLAIFLVLLVFKAMNPQVAILVASTQTEVASIQPGVSGSVERIGTAGVGELWSQPAGCESWGDRSLPARVGSSS